MTEKDRKEKHLEKHEGRQAEERGDPSFNVEGDGNKSS